MLRGHSMSICTASLHGDVSPTVQEGEQGDRRQATHHAPQGPWDGQLLREARAPLPTHHLDATSQHPRLMLGIL